ncbi:MATE family efflux transporter [Treponema sp. OMZ 840]
MTDMTTGNPAKLITRFALPLLLGNVLQQTYNIVDSIVVGNFIGAEALAAVGNSGIVIFLLVSMFAGVGMGAVILVSQFFGSKQHEKLRTAIDTIYIGMLAASILITAAGIATARPFLRFMHTPEGPTMEMSATYIRTLLLGTALSFGYNINGAILQGIGDSKSSLLFLSIATLVNIVLDLLFVAVFDMGVFGVALATVIAQGVSFVFGVWYINRKIKIFRLFSRRMRFDYRIFMQSFQIGLPAGIQNVLFCVGTIVLQRLVNGYGPAFMAGYSATNKIDMFVFMPIVSFANAVTTYVGQNIGAKNLGRVKEGVRSTIVISVGISIVMSIFVTLFGRHLLMAFTQDTDVLKTGEEFIKRLMPGYFLLAIIFTLNSAVRGAGESIIPMLSSLISLLVARIPLAYLFDYFGGRYNMFWCYGAGWLVGTLIIGPYYLSGRWKRKAFRFVEESAKT